MKRYQLSVLCAAIVCLGGCASKPPTPPHQWIAYANAEHLPLQGLSTVPRLTADERPMVLANLENDAEREGERQAAMASGAAAGAVKGGVVSFVALAPACVIMPPLCLGMAAVGAADGAARARVTGVSAEDSARLAAAFRAHAGSAALQAAIAKRAPSPPAQADELRVHLLGVVMAPLKEGVAFRMVAQAQALGRDGTQWKPTLHFVHFPMRPVEEWLASDAQQLNDDIEAAMSALSASIASTYVPYRYR